MSNVMAIAGFGAGSVLGDVLGVVPLLNVASLLYAAAGVLALVRLRAVAHAHSTEQGAKVSATSWQRNMRDSGMSLHVTPRTELVERIITQLETATPSSTALVRGSLAECHADAYSDIDLLWEVPDRAFASAIANLPMILSHVRPIASLRFDPDFQRSERRRLAFVRFADVPLFWRVDLDILAASLGRDLDYDRENAAARGTDWSLTESALMNAIAAIKAHLRGREHEAAELLERAEDRVGVTRNPCDVQLRLTRLLSVIAQQDPTQRPLVDELVRLVQATFNE